MFLLLLLFQLVVDIFLLICNTCFHLCSINYKNNLLGLKFDFTLSYTFWWKEILVLMGHVYFSIMIYAFVSLRKSSICKTQNSGLRPKEEKPRDPMNQPSRCNTKEGLLSVAQTGDSDLLGGRAHRTANWASIYGQKTPHYQHITYGLQSDWLHVCKAILLVQTSPATCLQSNSIGTTSRAFVQT